MDANFCLRSKIRGIRTTNVVLNPGMAYIVTPEPYADFIKIAVDEDEVSVCFYRASPAYSWHC